jgi:hypothetical protein
MEELAIKDVLRKTTFAKMFSEKSVPWFVWQEYLIWVASDVLLQGSLLSYVSVKQNLVLDLFSLILENIYSQVCAVPNKGSSVSRSAWDDIFTQICVVKCAETFHFI